MAYAVAHALARRLLAQLTGGEPTALRFDRDAYGKPFIVPEANATAVFSLSHCPASPPASLPLPVASASTSSR
jgi:phosphopantetheinyl transferase